MTWLSIEMTPTTPIWRLLLPLTAMGVGSAFIWAPLAATATRNLPPRVAGAGSGVYNTTRQVGSVLGSAGMAAFMTSRISAELPPLATQATQREGSPTGLPDWLHEPFAAAMSQSLLLPAFFSLFGVVAAMFLLGFGNPDRVAEADDLDDADRNAGFAVDYGGDETFVDDDEYLEYIVLRDDDEREPVTQANRVVRADDPVTEPMRSRSGHLLPPPADTWRGDPVESWHSLLDEEPQPAPAPARAREPAPPPAPAPAREPAPASEPPHEAWRSILDELVPPVTPKVEKDEPIGFAHNGFHVDDEQRFQPLPPPAPQPPRPSRHERRSRHYLPENQPQKRPFWFESPGRHSRDEDPDDATRYGRHSAPGRD
jgi:hypothetical protein